MIALLRGLVADRADDFLVVDVQGVGYRVFMPGPAIRATSPGEEVTLHIHTHVREDAIQLFGFGEPGQRALFLALCTVKGIGPKLALAVLANATPRELVEAVGSGDVKRLTHIPGLGKKTAERILVELKGTLSDLLPEAVARVPAVSAGSPDRLFTDVASALANLGFKPAQIDRALDALRADPDLPNDFDALFREAMRQLR